MCLQGVDTVNFYLLHRSVPAAQLLHFRTQTDPDAETSFSFLNIRRLLSLVKVRARAHARTHIYTHIHMQSIHNTQGYTSSVAQYTFWISPFLDLFT